MPAKLKIKLITPSRTILEEEAEIITANTIDGRIGIMANHTPIVSILKPGELLVQNEGKQNPLAVAGGVIEMFDNTLIILADTAERADEIDLERAQQAAKKLAEELKSKENLDINTYNALSYQLLRNQTRIDVYKKWRK